MRKLLLVTPPTVLPLSYILNFHSSFLIFIPFFVFTFHFFNPRTLAKIFNLRILAKIFSCSLNFLSSFLISFELFLFFLPFNPFSLFQVCRLDSFSGSITSSNPSFKQHVKFMVPSPLFPY